MDWTDKGPLLLACLVLGVITYLVGPENRCEISQETWSWPAWVNWVIAAVLVLIFAGAKETRS